jgi:hypothetical protein
LALLTGLLLQRWTTGESVVSPVWMRLSFGTLGAVGLGIAIALPLATRFYLPGEGWLGAIGAIPLFGAVCGLWFIHRQHKQAAAVAFTATAAVFVTTLFGFVLVRVDRHQQNHLLLNAIAQRSLDPTVASYRTLEPTWVFYGGRPIKSLGETQAVDQFLTSGRDRFLITTRKAWQQDLRTTLPAQAKILAECPIFLKKGELVLIACEPDDIRMAEQMPHPVEVRHRIERVERR